MKKAFLLSKQNTELAADEVYALYGNSCSHLINNLLVIDTNSKSFSRLAFTKAVYDVLFECSADELEKKTWDFCWKKKCINSFAVRVHGAEKSKEKEIAEIIWKKLDNPKVRLDNPDSEINFFFEKGIALCCILNKETDTFSFEKRRAHLRPAMHPSSMHPRLARLMVNLTGIKKGKLTDPFCGTGGILIEAELMGINAEGSDIDNEMVLRCRKNLKQSRIKIIRKDALEIGKKMSYVASDLPYGKATKSQDIEKLYSGFFRVLKKKLRKCAAIGLPDFTPNRKIIRSAGLKIKGEHTIYIHKSLSKKIFLLST